MQTGAGTNILEVLWILLLALSLLVCIVSNVSGGVALAALGAGELWAAWINGAVAVGGGVFLLLVSMMALFIQPGGACFVILAVPAPLMGVFGMIFGQRIKVPPGYCNRCWYDLRGSTRSTHCPECGKQLTRSELRSETL